MAGLGYTEEQFNNLTGDIELNPGSFGLFMRDIEEASLNLKTAIYSGNVNLTADIYKQLEKLSEKKYNAVDPDGSINTTRLGDTDMDGKSAGLYMNHQRLGYWDGDDWKAFIGNTGEMWLGSILETNYLHWTGTELTIKGDIILTSGETVQEAIDNIDVSRTRLSGKPTVISDIAGFTPPPTGSGFKLTNSYLGYYNNGVWKTYMQSNGNFGLGSTVTGNGLTWNGSTLVVRGDIQASSVIAGTSISGGKTSYSSTTAGYWMGLDSSIPKFNIGNSSHSLKWDGSNLDITGNITMIGGSITWSNVTAPSYSQITGSKPPVNAEANPSYITSTKITSTTIESPSITGGVITGSTLQTSSNSSSSRIVIDSSNGLQSFNGSTKRLQIPTTGDRIDFYDSSGASRGNIRGGSIGGYNRIYCDGTLGVIGAIINSSENKLGNLIPWGTNNIGSSSSRWAQGYFTNVNRSNSITAGTSLMLGTKPALVSVDIASDTLNTVNKRIRVEIRGVQYYLLARAV